MPDAFNGETDPVERLKQLDKGNLSELGYFKVEKMMQPVLEQIAEEGEKRIDELHALLKDKDSWSCLFALYALRKIKSEKSVMPLIEFLKGAGKSNFEAETGAMRAIADIGNPAVEPLIEEIKAAFLRKEYDHILVSALGEIEDERARSFVLSVANDFVSRPEDFAGWFQTGNFADCVAKNMDEEELLVLRKILEIPGLPERDKRKVEVIVAHSENSLEAEKLRKSKRLKKFFERMGLNAERMSELKASLPAKSIISLATENRIGKRDVLLREASEQAERNPDLLHALLMDEHPVPLVILKVLGEIKSEKSVPFIIEMARNTVNPIISETASEALKSIGGTALDVLLAETKKTFQKKEPSFHLTLGLAGFEDPRVDSFARWAVKGYLNDPEGLGSSFRINDFVYLFRKRDNKDLAALMRDADVESGFFYESQIRDVREAIEITTDCKSFERKFEERPEELQSATISRLIEQQRILEMEAQPKPKKTGRNEPCHCGSGKKYKKCGLDGDRSAAD